MSFYVFLNKKFLHRCSSVKVECSFDNSAENYSTEARRNLMNLQLFQTEVFTKNVLLKLSTAVMTILPKKFQPKPEEHSWYDKTFLTKFFRKNFFWKCRIQICQSCQKSVTRSPDKIYEPMNFSKQKLFQKCSSGTVEFSFDKAAKNFFTRSPEKIMKIKVILKKKSPTLFLRKYRM